MAFIKINDNLVMTFNEDFVDKSLIVRKIPKDFILLFDINIFRIKLYGVESYKTNNFELLNDLTRYELNIYRSISKLNSKKSIEINGISYKIKNIIHSKIFSTYQPHIPIIEVDNTIDWDQEIYYKDKVLGVKNNSNEIVPLIFLINICYLFIKNSGFFFFVNELEYNICEVIDNTSRVDYYLIFTKKFKINNTKANTYIFNPGDMIYSINGTHFNFNGHVYSEKYKLYLTLNTYILLHDIRELEFQYTPNKSRKINLEIKDDIDIADEKNYITQRVKTITINLDRFDETKLIIPNIDDSNIRYNSLIFNLLTEKLYQTNKNRIKIDITNKYSAKKIIITELDSILYKVDKISNKNITSLNDVELMLIKKNLLMSKRTIILRNLENGESKKIIL